MIRHGPTSERAVSVSPPLFRTNEGPSVLKHGVHLGPEKNKLTEIEGGRGLYKERKNIENSQVALHPLTAAPHS